MKVPLTSLATKRVSGTDVPLLSLISIADRPSQPIGDLRREVLAVELISTREREVRGLTIGIEYACVVCGETSLREKGKDVG